MARQYAKLVLMGDGGVGKTTLTNMMNSQEFDMNTDMTVGVNLASLNLIENEALIWDLAGQNRFRMMQEDFIKGVNVAIIVYDVTRPSTFNNLFNHITTLRSEKNRKDKKGEDFQIPIYIIGNKFDLVESEDERIEMRKYYDGEVRNKILPQLLDHEIFCKHMFTSAKSLHEVEDIFTQAGRTAYTTPNTSFDAFGNLLQNEIVSN